MPAKPNSREARIAGWCACAALFVLTHGGVAAAQTSPPPAPGAASQRVTLQEAIQTALQREPRVDIAQQEILRAETLIYQARATTFPTVVGNAVYTRLDDDRRLPTGQLAAGRDQLSANLVVSVPLLAPQRWVLPGHARDNLHVAQLDQQDTRRTVAIAVAQAYVAVVAQHRAIETSQRALDNAKAHADFAHARFAGGVGNRLDDVRANQELAASQAQLENANAGLARAQEALGLLLGSEEPIDAANELNLPEPPTLADGLAGATTQRSDVMARSERLKAARHVVKDQWLDYVPLIMGQFQPFYQNPATTLTPQTGWQAQLILAVPFYDGGLRSAQHDERVAFAAETQTQVDAALRQARSEVRVAFAVLQRADASLVSAAKAATLSVEALDMATQAYKAGATSNLEVIDAERRARDAETAAVLAEDNARRSRLDLLAATGRLP